MVTGHLKITTVVWKFCPCLANRLIFLRLLFYFYTRFFFGVSYSLSYVPLVPIFVYAHFWNHDETSEFRNLHETNANLLFPITLQASKPSKFVSIVEVEVECTLILVVNCIIFAIKSSCSSLEVYEKREKILFIKSLYSLHRTNANKT